MKKSILLILAFTINQNIMSSHSFHDVLKNDLLTTALSITLKHVLLRRSYQETAKKLFAIPIEKIYNQGLDHTLNQITGHSITQIEVETIKNVTTDAQTILKNENYDQWKHKPFWINFTYLLGTRYLDAKLSNGLIEALLHAYYGRTKEAKKTCVWLTLPVSLDIALKMIFIRYKKTQART